MRTFLQMPPERPGSIGAGTGGTGGTGLLTGKGLIAQDNFGFSVFDFWISERQPAGNRSGAYNQGK